MNKEHFLQAGFEVYESPHNLIITTPQTFVSGDPACFWVKSSHDRITFNDYGHSLNALELSLPNPDNAIDVLKRTLRKLDSVIELDGVALIHQTNEQHISTTIGEFINLFAMLTTYRPRDIGQQELDNIMAHIYDYLINRFGSVQEKVRFTGISGIEHKFAFGIDNHVFDYTKPKPLTTGTLLRKIHDIKTIHNDLNFNIFLDDSDRRTFDKEARILSSMANIKPLSLIA